MFSKYKESAINYTPDSQELSKLGVLLNIIKMCQNNGIEIFVVGGYGIDGMYGKLTREHDDIDILYHLSKYNDLKNILKEIGFGITESSDEKTTFVHDKMLPTFKVEIVPIELLNKYSDKPLDFFVTKEPNAKLSGLKFHTLTMNGQKDLINIINFRAKIGRWAKYPKQKRKNQKAVLKLVKKKKV
jgi:hypothetical protein